MVAACQVFAAGPGLKRRKSAGFDVAAKPPLRRDVLDIAQRQPHLPGRHPCPQGLIGRPFADSRQDQRAAEDAGVARPEFVVHKAPKVTDSHL